MFESSQRYNFVELIRPPLGYRLDSAVGTTYSMDFVALTAVMLALVDTEADEGDVLRNQVEALRAITRLSHNVRLFVNRTCISPDDVKREPKLYSLYDRVIADVSLKSGSFHPKVWALRYCPRQTAAMETSPPLVRVICSSRNLTCSQSWEAFVCFEGTEFNNATSNKLGTSIAQFFQRVAGKKGTEPVRKLIATLPRVKFELPKEMCKEMRDDCQFLWKWQDEPLGKSLPKHSERILILSPFVTKSFLNGMMDKCRQLTLISRQEELDAIRDEDFHRRLAQHKVFVVVPSEGDDDLPSMDLHAKIYLSESSGDRVTMLGSSNASDRAWTGGNCEAMMAFSPGISIEHFCKRFLYSRNGKLSGWIGDYIRQIPTEDDESKVELQMDELRRGFAQAHVDASYNQQMKTLTLSSPDTGIPEILTRESRDFRALVCPLSLCSDERVLMPVDDLFRGGLPFHHVEISDLTEFVLVEIAHRTLADQRKRFVIKAESNFEHLRSDRDGAILKLLLTPDKFQQYLRTILFDGFRRLKGQSPTIGHGSGGKPAPMLLFQDVMIEDILQSCTEDPTRIEEICYLLETFRKTAFVDEQFLAFWDQFLAAWKESQEATNHG